jgi:hypothetical protein
MTIIQTALEGKMLLTPYARVERWGAELPAISELAVRRSRRSAGAAEIVFKDKELKLEFLDTEEIVIYMGYRGIPEARVFTGYVTRTSRRPDFRSTLADDEILEMSKIKKSYVNGDPAKIAAEWVMDAYSQWEDVTLPGMEISLPIKPLSHVVVKEGSVKEALRQLRASCIKRRWGKKEALGEALFPMWYFDEKGRFHWHEWQPPAGPRYKFTFARNISTFEALAGESAQMRLMTYPHPWIAPGDVVDVDHPRLGVITGCLVDTHNLTLSETNSRSEFIFGGTVI